MDDEMKKEEDSFFLFLFFRFILDSQEKKWKQGNKIKEKDEMWI